MVWQVLSKCLFCYQIKQLFSRSIPFILYPLLPLCVVFVSPFFYVVVVFFNPYQKNKPSPPISLTPPKKKTFATHQVCFFPWKKKQCLRKTLEKSRNRPHWSGKFSYHSWSWRALLKWPRLRSLYINIIIYPRSFGPKNVYSMISISQKNNNRSRSEGHKISHPNGHVKTRDRIEDLRAFDLGKTPNNQRREWRDGMCRGVLYQETAGNRSKERWWDQLGLFSPQYDHL